MKILNTIGDVYTEEAKKILNQLGEVEYVDLTQEGLKEVIGTYDIVVIGLGLTFNKEVLAKAGNLKIIATTTTGLDHIDIDFAKSKDIDVISLRGETEFLDTITGTAELAMGLVIDLMRRTPWAFDSVKKYEWDRERFRGYNLYGKTLGIVGMGRLGRWMAEYGKAFGMDVIFCDPNVDKSLVSAGLKKTDFGELLESSDIISIHVHLTPETKNMFDLAIFEKMKEGALLVNTSRGEIVDEKDVLNALRNKQIGGYATDVLAGELDFNKGFSDHPLVEYAKKHNNVIIVPHIGGMTHESREQTDIFIAQKIINYLQE